MSDLPVYDKDINDTIWLGGIAYCRNKGWDISADFMYHARYGNGQSLTFYNDSNVIKKVRQSRVYKSIISRWISDYKKGDSRLYRKEGAEFTADDIPDLYYTMQHFTIEGTFKSNGNLFVEISDTYDFTECFRVLKYGFSKGNAANDYAARLALNGCLKKFLIFIKGYEWAGERNNKPAPSQPSTPSHSSAGFSYPNNAKCVNDILYIRDSNGNRIPDRYVSIGDNMTVLDVGYTKQLALVEYPTPSGVRSGYVKNATNCISYYYQDQYSNGSTSETVYDQNGSVLGSLDPWEHATPLYRRNGRLHVVYSTNKGKNTKSGYVVYNGKFTKF